LCLEPLHENLRCSRNVIAAQHFRTRTIAGNDGVQDRDMLGQDRLRHLRIVTQHLAHDAAQIRPMRRRRLAYQRVFRKLVDEGMKIHIGFDLLIQ